eukprot:1696310-Amphidinium_carterae.1
MSEQEHTQNFVGIVLCSWHSGLLSIGHTMYIQAFNQRICLGFGRFLGTVQVCVLGCVQSLYWGCSHIPELKLHDKLTTGPRAMTYYMIIIVLRLSPAC